MHRIRNDKAEGLSRRSVLTALAGLGVGTTAFQRAMAAQAAQAGTVTKEMIKQAEWIAGLELTEDERTRTARSVEQSLRSFAELRKVDVGYDVSACTHVFPGTAPTGGGCQAKSGDAGRDAASSAAPEIRRGARFSLRRRALGLDPKPADKLDRADEALSRPAQAIRPALEVRRDPHRGRRAQAGGRGRSRDRSRALSRAAARYSLGCEGPDRLSRVSHHLGSDALQGHG